MEQAKPPEPVTGLESCLNHFRTHWRQEAVLAGTALLKRNETGDMLITHSSPDLLAATLTLLKVVHEPPDKRVSFVDCLVMATATFYGTREIFGFDAVFERNGFHLPGKAEQQAA